MRRSLAAALGLVLLALPAMVAGQGADDGEAPEGLEARIRAEVARRWEVPAADIELETGSLGPASPAAVDARVMLLGSGAGGHWVARLEHRHGANESVRVRAGVRTTAPVAARDLTRGTELGPGDIRFDTTVRWGEPLDDGPEATEGWVVQRLLREGEPLRTPAVQPPLAVQSGEPVALVWERAGVGLRVAGKAAGSAAVGQRVYVRTENGRRLEGVVVAPGVVNVTQGGTE